MKNNTSKFWGVLDNALVSFLPQKAQFEILKSFEQFWAFLACKCFKMKCFKNG